FQIIVAPRPENVSTAPARRLLTPSEIYNRANSASVLIENLNDKARRRNTGTGFFIEPGKLLTAFQVIDGAAKVRVVGRKVRWLMRTKSSPGIAVRTGRF
ncbi:MAG: hypothetical protein ACRD6N_15730, partial [Pyrinomonadaceae bacterium]